jgi:hypothetical protein
MIFKVKFHQKLLSWPYCKGNRYRSFKVKASSKKDAVAKAKKIAGESLKYHSVQALKDLS